MKTAQFRRLLSLAVMLAAGGLMAVSFSLAGVPASAPRPEASAADKAQAADQYLKAKSLYDAGNYQQAMVENSKALQLDPDNPHAVLLKVVLQGKLGQAAVGTSGGPAAPEGGGKPTFLTQQQISAIRLMEMSSRDTPRGHVDAKVLDDYWEEVVKKDSSADISKAAHDNFVKPANFAGQVANIKASGNIKYIQQVTVNNDPAAMVAFKGNIETFVLQNCATAECHGGEKAVGLRLFRPDSSPAVNSDLIHYTNFFILNTFPAPGGKLIDRDNPESSLLLQYALPKTAGNPPHPGPDLRRPPIPNANDRNFTNIVAWIKMLTFPLPNYGITYPMPAALPVPATRQ